MAYVLRAMEARIARHRVFEAEHAAFRAFVERKHGPAMVAVLEANASFEAVRLERPTSGRAFLDLGSCLSPLLKFVGRLQRARLSGVCAGMRAAIAELPAVPQRQREEQAAVHRRGRR